MRKNPWYKATYEFPGLPLKLSVAHDLFSTQKIDDGTLLLLAHLPESKPRKILDMGCGYGALGLPIALQHKDAELHMVDRDLLAVEWAQQNSLSNQLSNTQVYPSLGFSKITSKNFDWILCNMPARIGKAFMEQVFFEGLKRLNPQGEIRIVVINDLNPIIESIKAPIRKVIQGARHTIYSLEKSIVTQESSAHLQSPPDSELYKRDSVLIKDCSFERPYDISGDGLKVEKAVPILLDSLPKKAPQEALFFRSSYGVIPIMAAKLWPKTKINVSERDLLAAHFLELNAKKHSVSVELRSEYSLTQSIGTYDFIMGEISSSASKSVAEVEILSIREKLNSSGQACLLIFDKLWGEWIQPLVQRHRLEIYPLMKREGYTLLQMRK